MNSTYGKLGWAAEHNVSQFVTADREMVLSEFAKGNINQISDINDRYVSYSGV